MVRRDGDEIASHHLRGGRVHAEPGEQAAADPFGHEARERAVDDAVEVLYDPANPQGSATISAIGAVWSAPLIAGLVGAVFVGTALFGLLSTSND